MSGGTGRGSPPKFLPTVKYLTLAEHPGALVKLKPNAIPNQP
jgi:hypothetical protein